MAVVAVVVLFVSGLTRGFSQTRLLSRFDETRTGSIGEGNGTNTDTTLDDEEGDVVGERRLVDFIGDSIFVEGDEEEEKGTIETGEGVETEADDDDD